MRKRGGEVPFSLFSFQDIITSVMGVMILVLLVVAVEMVNRQLTSPQVQHLLTEKETTEALLAAETRLLELQNVVRANQASDKLSMSPSVLKNSLAENRQATSEAEKERETARGRMLAMRRRRASAETKFSSRKSDRDKLDMLQQEVTRVRDELDQMISQKKLFFRKGTGSGQQPWMIEVSYDKILAAPLGPRSEPISFAGDSISSRLKQFLAWAKLRDPRSIYFVLMIRPDAASNVSELEYKLRELGFGVGLDLICQDEMVVDPHEGIPIETSSIGGN